MVIPTGLYVHLYIYMYPSVMINKYGPWKDTNMVILTGLVFTASINIFDMVIYSYDSYVRGSL